MEQMHTNDEDASAMKQWTSRKSSLLLIAAIAAAGALAACDRVERAWSSLTEEQRDPSTYGMPDGTPSLGQISAPQNPPVQEISREDLMAGDRAQQLARQIRNNMSSQFGCSQMADNMEQVADGTSLPLSYRINTVTKMADTAAKMGCL